LNSPVFDEVSLYNPGKKSIKFKFEPVVPTSCQLSFSPSSGSIAPGKTKKVKLKMILMSRANLNFKVTVRTPGGAGLFINLRVSGESGVFGVDPFSIEQEDDNGHRVPIVLIEMKKFILEHNGVNIEGIFRLAGEQTEIHRIKELMNKKVKWETRDVSAIASLLKIWFRDLPVPILNALPSESMMNFQNATDCVDAYTQLPEPQHSLMAWLLDLLQQISQNSDVNKMTPQNIAIVVAPNLYDISTPNPMEGLILSQKCAQFLNHVLNSHIAAKC